MSREWNHRLVESYDRVAERYADRFFRELDGKPFDRDLLDRYGESLKNRGRVCDLGCGPGHVAAYLRSRGVDVFGLDISPHMLEVAGRLNPSIPFLQGDMVALELPDMSLDGVVAFYSLIHLARSVVPTALAGINRVLAPCGSFLLAVHGGEGEVHADEVLGEAVALDATLFQPGEMTGYLEGAGFVVDEVFSRAPYESESQTQRIYVWATKAGPCLS